MKMKLNEKKILIILLSSAVVILGVVCASLLLKKENTVFVPLAENAEETTPKGADVPGVTSGGSIAIPGYESLTLAADTKKQTVAMINPAENNCYFVISLYLNDGTLLWESKEIAPGKASDTIKLTTPLASGTYEQCIVHYACYAMDKKRTQLNNAEVKLTLLVK